MGDESSAQTRFTYRKNQDGTIDSICLSCYRTVCTATSKDRLMDEERMHKCLRKDLDWLRHCPEDWKNTYT